MSEVPNGFTVHASPVLRWVFVAFCALTGSSAVTEPSVVTIAIAVGLLFATAVQWTWSATIDPEGLRFDNRVGASWHRPWGELREGVRVRVPGTLGALVRARTRTGRFVSIPNGVVRTLDGDRIAPETARSLIRSWAEAGTADPEG